jgi:hypothetical protein
MPAGCCLARIFVCSLARKKAPLSTSLDSDIKNSSADFRSKTRPGHRIIILCRSRHERELIFAKVAANDNGRSVDSQNASSKQ